MHLGEIIKQKLFGSGFSQADLAQKSGISQPAISSILRNPHVSTKIITAVSELININLYRELADHYEISLYKDKEEVKPIDPELLKEYTKLKTKFEIEFLLITAKHNAKKNERKND